jgi:hypothetical protein
MAARVFETQQRALNSSSSQLYPQRRIEMVELGKLRPVRSNARRHSRKQIRQIAASIDRFGFNNPLVVDDNWNIVAGHGRFAAAKLLRMPTVPVIRLSHLSETELRAYRLADNKLAENAGWNRQLLAIELRELAILLPPLGHDFGVIGFEPLEVQSLIVDPGQHPNPPVNDQRPNNKIVNVPSARRRQVPARVIGNELAEMAFANPYQVRFVGQAWARRDCGEMLADPVLAIAHHTADDGVNDVSWQRALKLVGVGTVVYDQQKNLGVWVQDITRQGAVYELISFYRAGDY